MNNPAARNGKPVIFVVILFLAVAIIYSSFSTSGIFARVMEPGYIRSNDCTGTYEGAGRTCCWSENTGIDSVVEHFCQTCYSESTIDCDEEVKQKTVGGGGDIVPPLEEGLAPPPPPGPGQGGPGNVLPEGVFEGPETAPTPEGPTELTPQVDCAQNPDDPQCETATIPEGEIDNETQSRLIGGSPTGKCNPTLGGPFCTPCDPLSTNPECIPVSQCVPPRCIPPRTDTGAPEEEPKPLVPPITTEEVPQVAPQIAPPTAQDGTGQPPTEPLCPEDQVLDEDTNLCVLEEPEVPEEQPAEEEQPSEESDSSDDSNN